ncbi:helix-turn-helix transcriptional regulator [Aeromicrobium terrae]|uniref:LuxR family transcriptional regulator n=1 Tax=Aeromicrobium terrae TaxID=2498846 RepID=A0A5C8NKQ4_9ACTN|nr:LuxR family transcriptional regulator [Aeromicrobium terrae]TXL61455.1 LuxR family transcriptional regulator [Aeromicrobium terrae]
MELLERGRELGALQAAVVAAASGTGSVVAVTGDAGVGKSVLTAAAVADAAVRVLWSGCDPLSTPRPLGPFRDVAADLGLGDLTQDVGQLAEVCEQIYAALRDTPTVLVVEDLHWADAASVEVLRFLARRVETIPLALLVTTRDHEVGAAHPARGFLGDVARLESCERLPLPTLSREAVTTLVGETSLDPGRVHVLTGGNPFFVTEIAKQPDRPLPVSVRDAVLARIADISAADVETLHLVAAAPERIDDRLLPALGVDLPTLQRLDATGLLAPAGGGVGFRHELARLAVESTIPPGGAAPLHRRLLDAHEEVGIRDPAVLTHHAVGAGDAGRAVTYATAAGEQAMKAGSHTDAAAFFETALHHLDGSEDDLVRAELQQKLGFEQYLSSRLPEAIGNIEATFPLWSAAGDFTGLASAHDSVAVLEYYNGRRQEAESHADRAADVATEAGARRIYAGSRVTRAYLAAQRNEFDVALAACADAAEVAEATGDAALAVRAGMFDAIVKLAQGDVEQRTAVSKAIATARERGLDELASTGFSNLVYHDVEHRRLRDASQVLELALPFAAERDIPICSHWQTGVRSRLHLLRGRWDAALEDAEVVLNQRGMPLGTMWPFLVSSLVPLRRGVEPTVDEPLEAAWRLAESLDEPVRRLPLLAALAEHGWMTGEVDERVSGLAVDELTRLGDTAGAGWALGDLAAWVQRLGLAFQRPSELAEPYRLSLDGKHAEAAQWWHDAGDPFAEALALGDATDPELRIRGVELLDGLGATATADRRRVDMRADGIDGVPARPRESTRANPGGLTNRQLEVARLMARGLTNAEISAQLFISPKTTDHHVSAVLTKLGVSSRRDVMLQSEELALT